MSTQAKPSAQGEVAVHVSFWKAAFTHVFERQMFVPVQVLFVKHAFPTAPTGVQTVVVALGAEAKHCVPVVQSPSWTQIALALPALLYRHVSEAELHAKSGELQPP